MLTKGNIYKDLTVVIADHLDNMRLTVAAMLTELGFKRVIQAKHGLEALSIIQKNKVDLIISDYHMPKMDGIDLLRKVRLETATARIPFVMISAHIEQEEVLRAIKNGVSEYVVKPFSLNMLKERISRAQQNPVKATATLITKADKTPAKEKKKERINILIVDDVADNIQVISEILRFDYKVRATTSGSKAIKVCQSDNAPDIVLLDIMMPEMDGLEVCKQLKANPITQHITVIFLTALDQTEDIVRGFELGAVDYITKPVNPPVVKARVKAHSRTVESNKLLAEQLDTMMENARLRDEFDRIAQNDLKNPLSEMISSIEMVSNNVRNPERVGTAAKSLKNSCTVLNQLIDNMITLHKLEDGSYQLNPVSLSLSKIVHEVLDTFALSANQKRLEIQADFAENHVVQGEALLTGTLLSNIITNAIEAAPRGSAIKVTIEPDNKYCQLRVHNYGMVPEDIQPCFFDKYVTYGKKDGSGIGTYSAKLMTEIQHGSIRFTTDEQEGTELIIALPK